MKDVYSYAVPVQMKRDRMNGRKKEGVKENKRKNKREGERERE